jgi:tRNA 2-(methylsulfanyl)-N6-isopentenyladenosine37 hydroxylase
LVDRLLVSSLIEARSCERFHLLGQAIRETDLELGKLYRGLWASEHGHYLSFLQLAQQLLPTDEVETRWEVMLGEEGKIIQSQPPGARMHSGLP